MKKPATATTSTSAAAASRKTGHLKSDSVKEPELLNRISPRRVEQATTTTTTTPSSSTSSSSSHAQSGGSTAVPPKPISAAQQNRMVLQEIVQMLSRPTVFTITKSSNNAGVAPIQPPNLAATPTTLSEDAIPSYIEHSIEIGLKYIDSSQMKEAIQCFRNAEILIDTYMQSSGVVSTDLMLTVVINLGICFYKVGLFDEAYSCFENSDMRLKRKLALKQQQESLIDPDVLVEFIAEQSAQYLCDRLAIRLKRKKLRLTLNLQMCILFSEIGKHQEAVDYARKAAKLAIHCLLDSLAVCYTILIQSYTIDDILKKNIFDKLFNSQAQQTPITKEFYASLLSSLMKEQGQYFQSQIDLASKCLPLLLYVTNNFTRLRDGLEAKLTDKFERIEQLRYVYETAVALETTMSNSHEKSNQQPAGTSSSPTAAALDMYFISSGVKENHWLLTSNILNLLQMKPIPLSLIQEDPVASDEITIDVALKSIVHAAISFYCISTEARFIEETKFLSNPSLSFKVSDSQKHHQHLLDFRVSWCNYVSFFILMTNREFWLGKSLEIAYTLIPQDALMISQIVNVFTRFHGIEKQIIPEDEEFPDQIKFLKPQKGVNITGSSVMALRNNFFIPVIRTMRNRVPLNSSSQHTQHRILTKDEEDEDEFKRLPIKKTEIQHQQPTQPQANKMPIDPTKITGIQEVIEQQLQQVSSLSQHLPSSSKLANAPSKMGSQQQQQQLQIQNVQENKISQTTNNQQQSMKSDNQPINKQSQQQKQPTTASTSVTTAPASTTGVPPSLSSKFVDLKLEEQFLNQQKYQQSSFLAETKVRSLSHEKRSQTAASNANTHSNNHTNTPAAAAAAASTKPQQQQQDVLDKIEALLRRQRPASSSSSSAVAGAAATASGGTQSSQHNKKNNHHPNSKNTQMNLNIQIQPDAICLTEPSQSTQTSTSSKTTKGKLSSFHLAPSFDTPTNHLMHVNRAAHSRTLYHHQGPQSQNQSPPQRSSSQSTKHSRRTSMLNQQMLSNNINNSASSTSATAASSGVQVQQNNNQANTAGSHNFLKSFNQFLKQNRVNNTDGSKKGDAPSKVIQTMPSTTAQSYSSIFDAHLNKPTALKQNFFEQHRISLPDNHQFQYQQQLQQQQSQQQPQQSHPHHLPIRPKSSSSAASTTTNAMLSMVPADQRSFTFGSQLSNNAGVLRKSSESTHNQGHSANPLAFSFTQDVDHHGNSHLHKRANSAEKTKATNNGRPFSSSGSSNNNKRMLTHIAEQSSYLKQIEQNIDLSGKQQQQQHLQIPTKAMISTVQSPSSAQYHSGFSGKFQNQQQLQYSQISYQVPATTTSSSGVANTTTTDENKTKPSSSSGNRQAPKRKSNGTHPHLNMEKLNFTMNPRSCGISAVPSPSHSIAGLISQGRQQQQLQQVQQQFSSKLVTTPSSSLTPQQILFNALIAQGEMQSTASKLSESAQRKRRVKTEHSDWIDDNRLQIRSSLERPSSNQAGIRFNTLV